MKFQKTIISFCLIVWGASAGLAQASRADIFDKATPVTWLGLDFSNAKFIGDREKYGSSSDIKFLIKSWNDLVEREYNKYNIGAALRKSKVDLKIDVTRAHNEELDVLEMMSNSEGDYLRLKEDDIATIIGNYDFNGLAGLGLMFNIESFNKQEQKAAIWVTFFDLSSKEILLSERFIEPAGGSGLRNYWGGAIFDTIDRIKAKSFEAWRKKYSQ